MEKIFSTPTSGTTSTQCALIGSSDGCEVGRVTTICSPRFEVHSDAKAESSLRQPSTVCFAPPWRRTLAPLFRASTAAVVGERRRRQGGRKTQFIKKTKTEYIALRDQHELGMTSTDVHQQHSRCDNSIRTGRDITRRAGGTVFFRSV